MKAHAESLAQTILLFCNLIQEFPLGNKAINIEIAISGYKLSLTACTRSNLPKQWAAIQNNLGLAYAARIRGKKSENLELAIAFLQNSLEVRTFDAFPRDWAQTQNNLGDVYRRRIREQRANNLEQAIIHLQNALTVYTFDNLPSEWAITQNNLDLVYTERVIGEHSDNLERAITNFQNTLQVRTFENCPPDWALTQNNLSGVYIRRIKGKRFENLEQAIILLQNALTVYTFEDFPIEWATTQNNLGEVFRNRIIGEPTENLEQAITHFHNSLKIRNFESFPQEWPQTQNNLGLAYIDRMVGESAENLEQAIIHLQNALTVYTFEDFPIEWATTQNNLGEAFRRRIIGEPTENLKQAITHYQKSLIVRNCEAFPQSHAETLSNLGIAYQNSNQLTSAYNTFASVITVVEFLREEIISGIDSKRKQAEQWNRLYSNMVKVCLGLNNLKGAIKYVELSKTRNLVELILERDSKAIFLPEVFTQLETYRDEIAVGQYQIQNGKAENPQVLAQHLQKLRQQRNELQNRYLPVGYGFKFDSFQPTLNEHTAIIEWYILYDKILAFIVTKKGEVKVWQSQSEDRKALSNWKNRYLQNYYSQKDQWRKSLEEALKELASILHIDEVLNHIPKHCDQLILIPHQFLHLFPLHAIPVNQNSENSSCLLDLFTGGVSYSPSCQLLQQVQQRKRPDFQSLFAIQNPTGDLNYADLEVQVIQSYFNPANVLKKTAATLTAINNSDLNTYHCAHFSCHGYFNLTNASKSALILADAPIADTPTKPDSERYLNMRAGETHDLEKCLTLDKIFALNLEKCRLVTLSACETGLIDSKNTSDEYIGLPSGFLLAGGKAVVSSLWTVSDLSTAFLMMKFYEKLQTINNVSIALNQAQQWLRNLTTEEFETLLVKYKLQIEEIFTQLVEDDQIVAEEYLLQTRNRKPYPFENPFYWAAFTATGV